MNVHWVIASKVFIAPLNRHHDMDYEKLDKKSDRAEYQKLLVRKRRGRDLVTSD